MKVYSFLPLLMCIFLLNAYAENGLCPQNNNRDLIQTGVIQFDNINKRQACKQILINYQVPNHQVQIAASVISTQNYHVSNGVDYAVKVGYNRNNKFTATLLSDVSAAWTKITVSYIVASRSDILMGSFLVDSFNTLKCLQESTNTVNTQVISSVVPSWKSEFLSAKAVVFVSGIKTISQQIDSIQIGTVQVNSSGILNVKVASSKGLQIQFLQLSYILVSSSFPYNFGYELNHPEYQFPVFEEFLNNKLVQVKWGISTGQVLCEGVTCPSQCLSKDDCTKLGGNLYNGHCVLCDKGTVFDGEQCISICNKNEIWNSESQQCVCIPTAIRVKSACNICPANSNPDKLQRQCICDTGYIWNNWKSQCLKFTCPVNSQPTCNQFGYQCVCKQGFYKINDVCKLIPECPLNSVFDIAAKKCVCTLQGQFMNSNGICISCGRNQTWDEVAKKCVCKTNFISLNSGCIACPAFSTPNAQKTKCVCNQGYIWNDWKVSCVPFKCPVNSVPQVSQNGVKCNCKDGYWLNGEVCDLIPQCPVGASFSILSKTCLCNDKNAYLIKGTCTSCPANSTYNGIDCTCNSGFVLLGASCVFVCGKNEVLQNGKCVCNSKCISLNNACQQCPANSSPSKDKMTCFCDDGYKWDQNTKSCLKIACPQNSTPQYGSGSKVPNCICNEGFILQNSQCVRVYRCPLNSVWSQQKLCCICTVPGQYMINNQCQKCPANQYWNDKEMKCVCNAGLNLVGGECKACDVYQGYNTLTQKCQCILGYFRNGANCSQCHTSCATCSGTAANQCLTCVDVTFYLKNGSCSKQGICPKGLYQRGSSCAPCSTYCSDCRSQSTCLTCIDGFNMQSVAYGGVSASYCVQKCGDGRRFELDCDDGNNRNGDGCSADCKIQSGWTCTGGSSTRPSTCVLGTPQRTYLQLTGTVHLYGRIVQGIRLSYIPEQLTVNDCAECYNLLWIRVIKSDIVPGVRVSYLPKSRFQFLAQFDFQGTFAIPNFNIAVQINPDYARYFNRRDMAQIQIKTIDPSVLAMKDKQQTLGLDDIIQDKKAPIKLSNTLVQEIFN